MKRALLVALALCLTFTLFSACAEDANDYTVGSIVTFGHYEQDNDLTNGAEPITWLVLENDGDRALLLSEYGLDALAYNKDFVPMTWAECTMRPWLNDEFLNAAFTEEEQALIPEVTITNPDNSHYSTKGGDDTTNKVYLLSLYETESYFPVLADRVCKPTAYAIAHGAFVNENNGNCWWWLRTPGVRRIDACGVRADGRISGYGSRDVNRPSGCIRPVIWVELSK